MQEITWISTGYAVAMVMVMPLTAFLGRLFGQKNVYLACLALFILGSALCGFAWNLPSLVVFRAIQGFGAGALQPTEQAILRQTFPPKEQGTAMALFAMAVMIGPALGPTLGGYIVDNFHWSWIFFINLPVGVLGFFMVWRFVHEPEDLGDQGHHAPGSREAAPQHGLAGHRPAVDRAHRAAVRAGRGPGRTTGSSRRRSWCCRWWWSFATAGLRDPRADGAGRPR